MNSQQQRKSLVGDLVAGAVVLVLGAGAVAFAAPVFTAAVEPASVIETIEPLVVPADAPNGLAAEQEAEAAAALEAARLAAEQAATAEAARVAAEAAALAEAERLAAEQAAEAESFEAEPEVVEPEPAPEPEFSGPLPGTQVHTICAVLEDGTQVPCQH